MKHHTETIEQGMKSHLWDNIDGGVQFYKDGSIWKSTLRYGRGIAVQAELGPFSWF